MERKDGKTKFDWFRNKVQKEGFIKVWSFRLHEDEWLEAKLRQKTSHQQFIEWVKSAE